MTYKIYRNNRLATKTVFTSYEAARQFVRKRLRTLNPFRHKVQPWGSLAEYGFVIKAV